MMRILLKIALFPIVFLLGFASVLTQLSLEIGARVGGIVISIFAVLGIINLIGRDLPVAAISGVIILLILVVLFFAANVKLLLDSLRDSLKRI